MRERSEQLSIDNDSPMTNTVAIDELKLWNEGNRVNEEFWSLLSQD